MKGIKGFLSKLMGKMIISCDKASFLMSKSLDTKLTMKEIVALKTHAFMCKYCRWYFEDIADINHAIHHINLNLDKNEFHYRLSEENKSALQTMIEGHISKKG